MISKNNFSEEEFKQLSNFITSAQKIAGHQSSTGGLPFLDRNDFTTYCDTIANIIRPKISKKITIDLSTILDITNQFNFKYENIDLKDQMELTIKFIKSINDYVDSIKETNYKLIYPLNIVLEVSSDKQDEFLAVINQLSNIKIYKSINDIGLDITEIKKIGNFDNYLNSRLIATYEYRCGDERYLLTEFHKDLTYLYGLIAMGIYQYDFNQYLTHVFLKQKKGFKIPESLFYIVYKNDKLSSFIKDWMLQSITDYNLTSTQLTTTGLKLIHIHDKLKENNYPYSDTRRIIDPIVDMVDKPLYTLYKEIISLYYGAISDDYAPTAYLKYFIICEKILKIGKKESEKLFKLELLKISNYTNHYYPSEHKEEIIDLLIKKRNKLVHEYNTNITSTDLNLIKMISESLIQFVFYAFINHYKNPSELAFFIEHFNLNDTEIDRRQNQLKEIKEDKMLNLVKSINQEEKLRPQKN